jgi:hypothetical protein
MYCLQSIDVAKKYASKINNAPDDFPTTNFEIIISRYKNLHNIIIEIIFVVY